MYFFIILESSNWNCSTEITRIIIKIKVFVLYSLFLYTRLISLKWLFFLFPESFPINLRSSYMFVISFYYLLSLFSILSDFLDVYNFSFLFSLLLFYISVFFSIYLDILITIFSLFYFDFNFIFYTENSFSKNFSWFDRN